MRVGGKGSVLGAKMYVPSSSFECWEMGSSLAAASTSRRSQVRSSRRTIWLWKVTFHSDDEKVVKKCDITE